MQGQGNYLAVQVGVITQMLPSHYGRETRAFLRDPLSARYPGTFRRSGGRAYPLLEDEMLIGNAAESQGLSLCRRCCSHSCLPGLVPQHLDRSHVIQVHCPYSVVAVLGTAPNETLDGCCAAPVLCTASGTEHRINRVSGKH